jgi:hypothetical protein
MKNTFSLCIAQRCTAFAQSISTEFSNTYRPFPEIFTALHNCTGVFHAYRGVNIFFGLKKISPHVRSFFCCAIVQSLETLMGSIQTGCATAVQRLCNCAMTKNVTGR